jgi:Leucine-rich repeat (LRR) protein
MNILKHPRHRWCASQMALLEEGVCRIDSCGLYEIPHEVLMKEKLMELHASKNALTTIPPNHFSLLVHIRVLRLDRNHISELPPEVGLLTRLSVLDLSVNQARAFASIHRHPHAE